MRPLLHGDITTAARALKLVPDHMRKKTCREWLTHVEVADKHVLKTGRLHRDWGNGSLMAFAQSLPHVVEPTFDDSDYCRCIIATLEAVLEHTRCGSHSDLE